MIKKNANHANGRMARIFKEIYSRHSFIRVIRDF